MKAVSRRAFFKQLLASKVGQDHRLYCAKKRTLVCVFLRGGADTLNMIIPYGNDRYYQARPTLAIAHPGKNNGKLDTAIRLDDMYCMHPKLAPLHRAYKDGRLAIVQSVGSNNPTGSHFEAQDQMEHGESYAQSLGGGWLGRYLHSRMRDESSPLNAVAIGAALPESLRGAPSSSVLRSVDTVKLKSSMCDVNTVKTALSHMYGAEANILGDAGRNTLDMLDRLMSIQSGTTYKAASGVTYPTNEFADGLSQIARLIKADVGLEIACIDSSGWDTHFVQGTTDGLQAERIDELARGIQALDDDLRADHKDRYLILIVTEFGRRIYENGSLGTDHGRGFAAMVLGDCVNGGQVLGDVPVLDDTEDFAFGPSGLPIKMDYRRVFADVLRGGLGCTKVQDVFPDAKLDSVGLIDSTA